MPYSELSLVTTLATVTTCLVRAGTENRTSLDNPVILAVESFKVTSYKFRFSDETMFILPSNRTAFTDKQISATSLN